MKRLTDKRLAIPPGQWQEVTREEARELKEIPVPPMRELYYRLSQIEDILCDGTDEYDLDRLSVLCNQRMTMREEVSERFGLTAKIPLDRLREIAEADREGRGDPAGELGEPGPPGVPWSPGRHKTYNELIKWLRTASGSPGGVKMSNAAADALEKLQAELEQVKRALAMMWFAYVNSDKETPHSYETEAIEEAERLLGHWEECMPKYLRRGQKEG